MTNRNMEGSEECPLTTAAFCTKRERERVMNTNENKPKM